MKRRSNKKKDEKVKKKILSKKITFKDYPNFTPNYPKQVFQMGAGGTYFRTIKSTVTDKTHQGKTAIKEYPKSWFQGLDIEKI